MKEIGELLKEKNLQLDTINPVLQGGFTQVPNFILKNPEISVGAKVTYAMFLSYAWHNDSCFPGQDRLAEDMGLMAVVLSLARAVRRSANGPAAAASCAGRHVSKCHPQGGPPGEFEQDCYAPRPAA
jgi:hypothetical protein